MYARRVIASNAFHRFVFLAVLILAGCARNIPVSDDLEISFFTIADSATTAELLHLLDTCAHSDSASELIFGSNFVRLQGKLWCNEDCLDGVHAILGGQCFGSHLKMRDHPGMDFICGYQRMPYLSSITRPFYFIDTTGSVRGIKPRSLRSVKTRHKGAYTVRVNMRREDSRRIEDFTSHAVSREIAICLNGEVFGTPLVREKTYLRSIPIFVDREGLARIVSAADRESAGDGE